MSLTAAGLQRGVVPLGSCYTPGKFVRVTVGVKPETLLAAGNIDATISSPSKGNYSVSFYSAPQKKIITTNMGTTWTPVKVGSNTKYTNVNTGCNTTWTSVNTGANTTYKSVNTGSNTKYSSP